MYVCVQVGLGACVFYGCGKDAYVHIDMVNISTIHTCGHTCTMYTHVHKYTHPHKILSHTQVSHEHHTERRLKDRPADGRSASISRLPLTVGCNSPGPIHPLVRRSGVGCTIILSPSATTPSSSLRYPVLPHRPISAASSSSAMAGARGEAPLMLCSSAE